MAYTKTGQQRRWATESQINTMKRILTENGFYDGHYDRLWKLLEAHEIDVTHTGDGTRIPFKQASDTIAWLIRRAREQRPARTTSQPAALGVYQRDSRIYVVREFKPADKDYKVRYARELIPSRPTQGDRLNGAGQDVRYTEEKAPRMQWELQPEELMPLEDVEALSLQLNHCAACGHKLEVAGSVRRGIGPVCAGRQPRRSPAALQLSDVMQ